MVRFFDVRNIVSRNSLTVRAVLYLAVAVSTVSVGVAQPPETIRKTSDTSSPERLSSSFSDIAKRVEPAVVSIDTKGKMPEVTIRGDQEGKARDLEDFIRRNLPPRPAYAVGSGFIVDARGYILTNYHVVKDAEKITVKLQDGDEFDASVIGADEETDIAVLKIDAGHPLTFINFGNSDQARIGDWVLAIGSPFGLARTVTAGIISQTDRATPDGNPFQRFIQTDAAINRGNSGGPLVDMDGNVIGVNSQIATTTGDYNGIGFALPSKEAEYVYRQILAYGKVKRGYLGVYLDSVEKEFAKVYGLKDTRGAIVTSVRDPEGAAARAGLKENDIIIAVDNQQVLNAQDLIGKIASTAPGRDVVVSVLREAGEKLVPASLKIRLDERPGVDVGSEPDSVPRPLPIDKTKNDLPFGLTLEPFSGEDEDGKRFEGRKGLMIARIDPASFVGELKTTAGGPAIVRGDLIERINRKPVTTLEAFKSEVSKLRVGDPVVLHISSFDRGSKRVIPRVVQFTIK